VKNRFQAFALSKCNVYRYHAVAKVNKTLAPGVKDANYGFNPKAPA
jgi:hypothetical protein